jgi:DHA1 family tetracycline resistance protein-like MFS transporter
LTSQRGLAVLWSTSFIDQMGFGIVVPILPLYAKKFGASAFEAGMLLAVYSLAQWTTSTWWGRLSDRIGRRPVIIAAAIGGCAGFIVIGSASALWVVLIGRAVLGCFGVGTQTAQAWIADTTSPEQRGRAMALLGAAGGLGFVAGPAIGALAILAGGMRLAFVLSAGCAAANAIFARLVLPHAPPVARTRTRSASGWRLVVPCLVVGFTLTYALSGVEATFALFTTTELSFAPSDNGWAYAGMALVAAATQIFIVGRLSARWSDPRRVALGLVALGLGVGFVPTGSLGALIPSIAMLSVGYAIAVPSLAAWVSRRAPAERQGELLGLAQSVSALARVAGPGIGGLLFDHVGHSAPFHVSAAMIGIVALATFTRAS